MFNTQYIKKLLKDNASTVRNITALLNSNFSTILLQFLSVPILMKSWGLVLYADWIILFTIPSLLSFSDLGVTTIANNKIEAECSLLNYNNANKILATNITTILLMFILIQMFFQLILIIFHDELISFRSIDDTDAKVLIVLLISDSFASIMHNHISSLFRTFNRYDLTIRWQTYSRFLSLFIPLLFVWFFNFDMVIFVCFMFAIRLTLLILMTIQVVNKCSWINKKYLKPSIVVFATMAKIGMNFMLLPISNIITLQLTTLIISSCTSASMLVQFTTMRTLTRFIPQFISIVGKSRWSDLTKGLIGNGNGNGELIKSQIILQASVLILVVCLVYILSGKYVYLIWVQNSIPFNNLIFFSFLFLSLTIATYTTLEVVPLATNDIKAYSKVFFCLNLIPIITMLLMCNMHVSENTLILFNIITSTICSLYISYWLYRKYY